MSRASFSVSPIAPARPSSLGVLTAARALARLLRFLGSELDRLALLAAHKDEPPHTGL